ncbi:MAG: ferritin-like domain-containing protein [Spirochaetaceae bacterium]|nr:ferritin-like domain-containing protein [Spirochaetaceae bacterium]
MVQSRPASSSPPAAHHPGSPLPADDSYARVADAELERVLTSFDTCYVWRYGSVQEGLRDLYAKAKRDQWDAALALDWSIEVDPEEPILPEAINPLLGFAPYERMDEREQKRVRHCQIAWQLSQFMHGEQGAMIVASQLVGAVPWMDAKLYASSQTMDEARHVEVFSRYLRTKLEWEWPVNPNLKRLLDTIIGDVRWDFKYLGMQILVEGLAMAAFANLHQLTNEKLLKDLIHLVMRDESRHVAFGVLSLQDFYADMSGSERRDREDFVIEACELMRDRLVGEETADAFGFDREPYRQAMVESPILQLFRQQLFSRVVPNLRRLGLLSPRVRTAFDRLGILQFEDADPAAQDAALGLV